MDNKEQDIKEVLIKFIQKHKQYRSYDVEWLVVDKVWNRGMGCREWLKVSSTENLVWVGKGISNKSDYKHLTELISMLNEKTGRRYVWMEVEVNPYPKMTLKIPNKFF